MGILPEDRDRRWRSIARRYGIPTGTDAEPNSPADKMDELKENTQKALFPGPLRRPDKTKRPKT
jgi:hypothetical protein